MNIAVLRVTSRLIDVIYMILQQQRIVRINVYLHPRNTVLYKIYEDHQRHTYMFCINAHESLSTFMDTANSNISSNFLSEI